MGSGDKEAQGCGRAGVRAHRKRAAPVSPSKLTGWHRGLDSGSCWVSVPSWRSLCSLWLLCTAMGQEKHDVQGRAPSLLTHSAGDQNPGELEGSVSE